jgi:hypothetical protein
MLKFGLPTRYLAEWTAENHKNVCQDGLRLGRDSNTALANKGQILHRL